jgi:Lon protease-like protein
MQDESVELDLFPLGTVLLPFQPIPLQIFEPRYLALMRECRAANREFGICLIEEGAEVGAPAIPRKIGTEATIEKFQALRADLVLLVARGRRRFRILRILREQPHIRVSVEWLDDAAPTFPGDYVALRRSLERMVEGRPGSEEIRAVIEQTPASELLGLTGALLAGHNTSALQQILEGSADQIVPSLIQIVDTLTGA